MTIEDKFEVEINIEFQVLNGMFVESFRVFQHKENEDYFCICDFENKRIGFAYCKQHDTISLRQAFSYTVMMEFRNDSQLKKLIRATYIN